MNERSFIVKLQEIAGIWEVSRGGVDFCSGSRVGCNW